MGKYYEPAVDLKKVGRRLGSAVEYAIHRRALRPGEEMVGLLDRGVYFIAPYLPDETEFAEFFRSYSAGNFLSFDIFAVTTTEAP